MAASSRGLFKNIAGSLIEIIIALRRERLGDFCEFGPVVEVSAGPMRVREDDALKV